MNLTLITEENLDTFCQGRVIQIVEATNQETAVQKQTSDTKIKVNATVRVDVERLEKLMNLVGELVIDQTRLVDIRNRFNEGQVFEEDISVFGDVTNHLSRIISELQEGIMKVRMLPIEQLFNRFPRMIRDLAQASGKEVQFILEGKETELDRTLIEEIGDPLINLLRNSV